MTTQYGTVDINQVDEQIAFAKLHIRRSFEETQAGRGLWVLRAERAAGSFD